MLTCSLMSLFVITLLDESELVSGAARVDIRTVVHAPVEERVPEETDHTKYIKHQLPPLS